MKPPTDEGVSNQVTHERSASEKRDLDIEKQSDAMDQAVRDSRTNKRGRPKKRSPGKYTMTPRALAQRQTAWTKALENMPVGEKKGSNKVKIKDGYTHLNKMKELTNCSMCPGKSYCPEYDNLKDETGEALQKCPMWLTYRKSIVDVLQNPLMYLAKKAGELDIAIAQQKMKDHSEGIPISKQMLEATKLAMEAVKIAQREENRGKGKRRILTAKEENEVIDADFTIPGE